MELIITKGASDTPSVWYVPDFRDNRTSDNPFSVEIKPLSAGQLQAKKERELDRGRGARGREQHAAHQMRNAILAECILSVEGVGTPKLDASGEPMKGADGEIVKMPITTGREFVKMISASNNPAHDMILENIYEAITDLAVLEGGRRPS